MTTTTIAALSRTAESIATLSKFGGALASAGLIAAVANRVVNAVRLRRARGDPDLQRKIVTDRFVTSRHVRAAVGGMILGTAVGSLFIWLL